MKIQCDVCNKDEATMFCTADEAALCDACDQRVHHANKLASKHQRFSLLQPSPKQAPLCDICQERRAFFFCQQDRAILCRECDAPIHKANEHTRKHNRFLLTGVKLSATSTLYSSSSSSSPTSSATSLSNSSDAVAVLNPQSSTKNPVSVTTTTVSCQPSIAKTTSTTIGSTPTPSPGTAIGAVTAVNDKDCGNGQLMNDSASCISEYLMEMLPGWHVEDLFDSSSPNGFYKDNDNDVQPFWDGDLGKNMYCFSAESTSIWVPQVLPPVLPMSIQTYPSAAISFCGQIGSKESKDATNFKPTRKWNDDNSFAVPQMCPPSATASKRSRTLW